MPLYEYKCTKCGVQFEKIQKFSDPLVTICPTCGGPVEKMLSSPAFQFKGTGFYVTDYSRKGEAESKRASEMSAGKAGKSDESKTEGSKSEGGKSDGAKSETKDAAPAPASTPKPAKSE
jgi:putative FmdB family regulatory protein